MKSGAKMIRIGSIVTAFALTASPAAAGGLGSAFSDARRPVAHAQFAAVASAVALSGDLPSGDLAAVNSAINALPYVEDAENYGVRDYWAAPAEMLERGGDCEDYAIAKMAALRAMGYADADMRIAVVWDAQDREEHAVLLVREGDTVWALDNKHAEPAPAADLPRYRLLYSVGMDGARFAPDAPVTDGGRTVRIQVR